MDYFSSDFTLGILGGGQLGKMLLYPARQYDIRTKVLDPSPDAPSRLACHQFVQGSLTDYDTVYDFGKDVQVLTIEIEGVNTEALRQLEREGVQVHPSAQTLSIIQNKAKQKQFYAQQQIPTAPFSCFENLSELVQAVEAQKIALPFVWKSALFGYDGNGVQIVKDRATLLALPDTACIAENFVRFEKELSVIVARNPKGETAAYPATEMEFHPEANQVEYVLSPARIAPALAQQAENIALQTAEALGVVGLLAVEMFLTPEGEIWVNEVAPRPHNSGHHTLEASYTSQFEQHLRAILNLPLGSTHSKLPAVMVNLVGAEGHFGAVHYQNIRGVMQLAGVNVHIYGKRQTKPFRKMGHVTLIGESLAEAREKAQQVKALLKVIART